MRDAPNESVIEADLGYRKSGKTLRFHVGLSLDSFADGAATSPFGAVCTPAAAGSEGTLRGSFRSRPIDCHEPVPLRTLAMVTHPAEPRMQCSEGNDS